MVLGGACLAAGSGAIPYAPFVEALRGLTRSVEPARLPALLGPARNEIARLLPEVAPRTEDTPARLEFDRAGQTRLFEAVLGVIERQARGGPVVLVVEDIQWADDGTRGLLGFLSRNLRQAPVLLLVTLRTGELLRSDPALAFVAELERDEWVERLDLRGLDRREVAALLRAQVAAPPSAATVDDVIDRTGGNPFFVEQLAATIEGGATSGDLPPELRDVLVARLAGLPNDTQRLLRAASAAGRRVDEALLAAVLEMPAQQVADALRPAVAGGILVDADPADDGHGGYSFRHALLAEVANDELLQGERDRLHAAFGGELERRGEIGGLPVTPAELAFHWVAARDVARAVPALVAAGAAAERVYAFAEARRHYERALQLSSGPRPADARSMDRSDVMQRAAECAVLTGAYDRAVELGRAAIAAAQDVGGTDGGDGSESAADRDRLGTLHERLRWFLWEAGDRTAAGAAVEEALRLIPAEPPSASRTRVLAQAAGLHLLSGDPAGAATVAREAIRMAQSVSAHSEEALALGVLGWSEAVTGDVDRGIATFQRGLAIAERLGGVEGIALGRANLAALLDRVGRTEASLDAAREGFAIARHLGVPRTYGGVLLGHVAKALFDLGRWDEAAAAADEGLELDPVGRSAVWLHVNRARVDTNRGQFEIRRAAPSAGRRDRRSIRAGRGLPRVTHGGRRGARRLAGAAAGRPRRGGRGDRLDPARRAAGSGARLAGLACAAGGGGRGPGGEGAPGPRCPARDRGARQPDRRSPGRGQRGWRGRHGRRRAGSPRQAVAGLVRAEFERMRGATRTRRGCSRPLPRGTSSVGRLRPPMPAIAAPRPCSRRTATVRSGGRPARSTRDGDTARCRAASTDIERLARHARIDLAAGRTEVAAGGDVSGLTDREREVIRLVAAGLVEPADRRHPVHHPQDGERPRLEHPRQARRGEPGGGRGRRASAGPGGRDRRGVTNWA